MRPLTLSEAVKASLASCRTPKTAVACDFARISTIRFETQDLSGSCFLDSLQHFGLPRLGRPRLRYLKMFGATQLTGSCLLLVCLAQ